MIQDGQVHSFSQMGTGSHMVGWSGLGHGLDAASNLFPQL